MLQLNSANKRNQPNLKRLTQQGKRGLSNPELSPPSTTRFFECQTLPAQEDMTSTNPKLLQNDGSLPHSGKKWKI
jgi:hypothetical protein